MDFIEFDGVFVNPNHVIKVTHQNKYGDDYYEITLTEHMIIRVSGAKSKWKSLDSLLKYIQGATRE